MTTTYQTGTAPITILAAVAISFFLVFLDMAIMVMVKPTVTTRFDALADVWAGTPAPTSSPAPPTRLCRARSTAAPTSGGPSWLFFLVFDIGSTLSGAAASSGMFVVGRAVAGTGSADLFTSMMTMVANVLPLPKEAASHPGGDHGPRSA